MGGPSIVRVLAHASPDAPLCYKTLLPTNEPSETQEPERSHTHTAGSQLKITRLSGPPAPTATLYWLTMIVAGGQPCAAGESRKGRQRAGVQTLAINKLCTSTTLAQGPPPTLESKDPTTAALRSHNRMHRHSTPPIHVDHSVPSTLRAPRK